MIGAIVLGLLALFAVGAAWMYWPEDRAKSRVCLLWAAFLMAGALAVVFI